MTTGNNAQLFVIFKKYSVSILAFSLILGLHSGMIISANSASVFSLMRSTVLSPVSIVGRICLTLIPFLISAVCVQLHVDYILPILACAKGFSFGFVSCAVYRAFGSAGWLVRILFQFSGQWGLILLILFWLRFAGKDEAAPFRSMLPYYIGAVGLCMVDYLVIVPFLQSVI